MRVIVTGAAGFIGYHVAKALLARGDAVLGYDSVNDYYDPALKWARLRDLEGRPGFSFVRGDLCDREALTAAWERFGPERVLHLAAQAGVRYSIEQPMSYIQANLVGFQHVLELVREHRPANFVYASSSSVYGGNEEMPFREDHDVKSPISLYAATKVSNELVARTYNHLYAIPSTGLRFFTVYGPLGRPDMAMFRFASRMLKGEPIPVYNRGDMVRDFTYVDDIVQGTVAALDRAQPCKVYNLGRGAPMELMHMIRLLEQELGTEAELELLPMQAGDVPATLADVSLARAELGYEPKTDLAVGVARFCEWFLAWQRERGHGGRGA